MLELVNGKCTPIIPSPSPVLPPLSSLEFLPPHSKSNGLGPLCLINPFARLLSGQAFRGHLLSAGICADASMKTGTVDAPQSGHCVLILISRSPSYAPCTSGHLAFGTHFVATVIPHLQKYQLGVSFASKPRYESIAPSQPTN